MRSEFRTPVLSATDRIKTNTITFLRVRFPPTLYRFAAFFADVSEKAVGRQDQTPIMKAEQAAELKKLDADIARLQAQAHPQ